MQPSARSWSLQTKLLVLASALPACLIVILIYLYGVNVPILDEWDASSALFAKYLSHTLTLADYLQPQMEHRPLIPRGVDLLTSIFISSNRRVHMMISVLVVFCTSLLVLKLAHATLRKRVLLLWGFANLFLFSTVQYENWLWGEQYIFFFAVFFVVAALTLTYSELSFWKVVVGGIGLWIASVFSFSAGFAAAPVIAAVQLLHLQGSFGKKAVVATLWACAFATLLLLCRVHPEGIRHGFGLNLHEDPSRLIEYLIRYYATPFQLFNAPIPIILRIGSAVILFALAMLVRALSSRQDFQNALPWAGLIVFSLITAAATANARLNMGTFQAMQSRYTTFSLLLVIGSMVLFAMTIQRGPWPLRWLANSFIAFALAVHLATAGFGVVQMRRTYFMRSECADALREINHNPSNQLLLGLYPDAAKLRVMANEYSRVGAIERLDMHP